MKPKSRPNVSRAAKLSVESLESRQLMTIAPYNLFTWEQLPSISGVTLSAAYGRLTINAQQAANVFVARNTTDPTALDVTINQTSFTTRAAALSGQIVFNGSLSDDTFVYDDRLQDGRFRVIAQGSSGNDYLSGGSGPDTLFGGPGVDTLSGGAGLDYLAGGLDGDHLYGGSQNDLLFGEAGDDYLAGEGGQDTLLGGSGTDRLYGESAGVYHDSDIDSLDGSADYDYLDGGLGRDRIYEESYPVVTNTGTQYLLNRIYSIDFDTTAAGDLTQVPRVSESAIESHWKGKDISDKSVDLQATLGLPVSFELIAADGRGRYALFQNGAIYWSPETGAYELHGPAYQRFSALGGERGVLG